MKPIPNEENSVFLCNLGMMSNAEIKSSYGNSIIADLPCDEHRRWESGNLDSAPSSLAMPAIALQCQ